MGCSRGTCEMMMLGNWGLVQNGQDSLRTGNSMVGSDFVEKY